MKLAKIETKDGKIILTMCPNEYKDAKIITEEDDAKMK